MSSSTRYALLLALAAAPLIAPATTAALPANRAALEQVGHEPLMHRGMNAAIAVHGDYAYIGSRTDGGHEGMPHTGNHEKVVMWSYPIIAEGLIYVTDVRNGLYVLKYEGPHARDIRRIAFLEGNSNQGDALCFEPVGPAGRHCA